MIKYSWFPSTLIVSNLLLECAQLYSEHYGYWGENSANPGGKIRLSSDRLKEWINSQDSKLVCARNENDELVGYAIAVKTKIKKYGVVSWVTQLVVHEDYRKKNVAKTMLFSIWGFSDHFSWGLVTANPYAVRALEKATRRRCKPIRIKKNYRKMKNFGIDHIPYINKETVLEVTDESSLINTNFKIDHSELPVMLKNVTSDEKPWLLGSLPEGWEWLAFTFNDQNQISLTQSEIDEMLSVGDIITQTAYSRMQLTKDQAWIRFTSKEVEFIIKECQIFNGQSIVDFGCGNGRHCIELASKGFHVTGIDYIENRIVNAKENLKNKNFINCTFTQGDCREINLNTEFHSAICLYDVVGTFPSDEQNIKILKNIHNHLKSKGRALISVMSMDYTKEKAKNTFNIRTNPDKLLSLKPSRTMETTGNVFNPDYYLLDENDGIVYRKEQFELGNDLPEELIVRDRRYSEEEIINLCKDAGFIIIWSRHVSAGNWENPKLPGTVKEILILCEKK
jgi:2-polyprenyl-3-methyl-5-hydroxy-6-metoxy-1,4-benzoquinol methylase